MTLSVSDVKLSVFSQMQTKFISGIFSNVLLSSLVLTLVMLVIFSINSDNAISSLVYGYVAVLAYSLMSAHSVRSEYSKTNSLDSDFSKMMSSVNTGPVITGKREEEDDFAALAHILN